MLYVNYAVCVLAVVVLALECVAVFRNNKLVKVKGADDFFTFALVLLFAVLIFPMSTYTSMIEALRNSLVLMAVLATLAVKRGLAPKGVQKLGYMIYWEQIEKVLIDEYQTSKIVVTFMTGKRKYKLFFNKYKLKDVLSYMEQHLKREKILMQNNLEDVLKMKKASK